MYRRRNPEDNRLSNEAHFLKSVILVSLLLGVLVILAGTRQLMAEHRSLVSAKDSDGDGLSNDLEQALLQRFMPTFHIGREDCANLPAEFQPDKVAPTVEAENGTIYGQVFPAKISVKTRPVVEIHYYHLWRTDCGSHGHPLDTEHVAALVQASDSDARDVTWKALYWYAAAHEKTVCDVSQIARASTLGAEDHGAKVWVSPGKHASYLNEKLCRRGCGADRCEQMKVMPAGKLINLGELEHPMNGAVFISSTRWPLASKMAMTNFPQDPIERLNQLPETDIDWFQGGRHPAQQVIAVSASTEGAMAESSHNTSEAIAGAGDSTGNAIWVAEDSTGNALQKSYGKTAHALGISVRKVGQALRVSSQEGGATIR